MKRFAYIFLMSLMALCAAAKPIDEAKALYADGNYAEAIKKLEAILKGSPRDMTANYFLGMSYLGLGEAEKAKGPLLKAEDRGSVSAAKALATLAIDEYCMDDAAEHLDTWEALLKKARKPEPEELSELRSRAVLAKNMLERVERIAIVDSIVVDEADFFKYYRLSAQAGKLLDGAILPSQYVQEAPAVVFEPENNKEVFWAMADSGALSIYCSQILDDGTFEAPQPLGQELNEGGDADYMYLTSDGVTFYFANTGENSLGGYDIFMSRRDADGSVLQPQNVGMPYNSPYDDYMLVIDEAAGLGWWATDRNQIPGKVTIYTFVPNETRENYDPDDERLRDFAFIRSIAATQGPGQDSRLVADNPALSRESEADDEWSHFSLSLGDGRVYTSLDQFARPQARRSMEEYLTRKKDLAMMLAQLSILRERYSSGDTSARSEILSLEKRVEAARAMMKRLRNAVITAETR